MQVLSLTDNLHVHTITLTERDTLIILEPCGALCQGICMHIVTIPDGVIDGFEKLIVLSNGYCRYSFEFRDEDGSLRTLTGSNMLQDTRIGRFLHLKWVQGPRPMGWWVVLGFN